MERLIFVALVIILFSPLVNAYDYEDQRRRQARDSGQLSLQEPQKKQNQSIKEKTIKRQKTAQRKKNQKRLRHNREMGRGDYPPLNNLMAK